MSFIETSTGKYSIVVVAISVALVLGWYIGQFEQQGSEKNYTETALEHSIKHIDTQYQCPMHPNIIKDEPGTCPICGMALEPIKQEVEESQPREKKILYWMAPMDPNYRRDEPGKSPMGMDLIPVYDDGGSSSDGTSGPTVKISPAVENNLGVRTAKVESGKLWRKIDTVGYVVFDESRVSHIHLRVDGWIEKLAISVEGERVKKGQRLFDVYSPKLVNSMEEYVQALRSANQRLIRASHEKLVSLGVSERQVSQLKKNNNIPRTISIYASQDGIVTMMMVREGMYVKPSTQVMTLADLSSVWVIAEVFESQSTFVKEGQQADVELSFTPGKSWEGIVEYVYPSLDEKNRTLRVRLRFDNPGEVLKPNMYANVSIYGGARENVLSIPREAVIRSGKNERAIISVGEGRYMQREIVTGIESGDWIEVISGLDEGENIVTSAQFLIDSEASMKASLQRMSKSSQAKSEMQSQQVTTGKGKINSVMQDHGMINLDHEAIDELGWPEMTMDFNTQQGVSLQGLAEGDEVEFDLVKTADGYRISAIRKRGVK